MPTQNIATTKTGTGWTVDVTAANLLTDTDVKDFIALHGGVTANLGDYTKTSSTLLTYNGAALPSNTPVEIRRKTPNSVIQTIQFGDRFSSTLWNQELDRFIRWREEADLNGVGAGSLVSVALPQDAAYSSSWNGDTIFPPTRNAVYDKFEVQQTQINADIAALAALDAVVATKAPLNSPGFTGAPTAPTQNISDDSTKLATTGYVKSQAYLTSATAASTYLTQANPTASTGVFTLTRVFYGNSFASGSVITLLTLGVGQTWALFVAGGLQNGVDTGYSLVLIGRRVGVITTGTIIANNVSSLWTSFSCDTNGVVTGTLAANNVNVYATFIAAA